MTSADIFILIAIVLILFYWGFKHYLNYLYKRAFPPKVYVIATQKIAEFYGKETFCNFSKYGGTMFVPEKSDLDEVKITVINAKVDLYSEEED